MSTKHIFDLSDLHTQSLSALAHVSSLELAIRKRRQEDWPSSLACSSRRRLIQDLRDRISDLYRHAEVAPTAIRSPATTDWLRTLSRLSNSAKSVYGKLKAEQDTLTSQGIVLDPNDMIQDRPFFDLETVINEIYQELSLRAQSELDPIIMSPESRDAPVLAKLQRIVKNFQ